MVPLLALFAAKLLDFPAILAIAAGVAFQTWRFVALGVFLAALAQEVFLTLELTRHPFNVAGLIIGVAAMSVWGFGAFWLKNRKRRAGGAAL